MCHRLAMPIARGREFWARLVREVSAGESRMVVAKRHRVSSTWLGKWCQRLAAEQPAKLSLLPVRLACERVRRMEITIDEGHLAFDEGMSPEYVGAVVRALRP